MFKGPHQPRVVARVAPVTDGIPNQKMEQRVIGRGNRPPEIGLSLFTGNQNSGLLEEFFREIGQHRLALAYKIQVRMQAYIFHVNDAQTIQIKIARQALKSCIVMPAWRQDHFQEERWLPAPVGTDLMFDSVYEGIPRVLRLKRPDTLRDLIDAGLCCGRSSFSHHTA